MESLEHNCGNISLTICSNMLIFGKGKFSVLIAWMISTDPIILQIFIFVTSHYHSIEDNMNQSEYETAARVSRYTHNFEPVS